MANVGPELVDQLLAQLDVVVDLAVEGEQVPARLRADGGYGIGSWLNSTSMIDSRLCAKITSLVEELHAGVVRASVMQALQGGGDRVALVGRGTGVADEHEHSAHGRHLSTG